MITKIQILSDDLHVYFNGEDSEIFPNIWLRDHAKDEDSWDHRSNQRKIFTAKLDPKLHIKKAILKDNGKSVDILWSDLKKPINYSSNFFLENSNKSQKINNNIKIWDKKDIGEEIYTDFQNTITNDGFKEFLEKLYKFCFVVIQN